MKTKFPVVVPMSNEALAVKARLESLLRVIGRTGTPDERIAAAQWEKAVGELLPEQGEEKRKAA